MKINLNKLSLSLVLVFVPFLSNGQTEYIRALNLRGQWNFAIGDNVRWADPAFNDSAWESVRVPGTWEDNGFYGYDGFAWYRLTFAGSLLDPDRMYWLLPGYIDDADETYLNGKIIGKSGSFPPGFRTAYKAKRQYPVPAGLINYTGKNVIAIRVYDGRIGGGIAAGPIGFYTLRNYGFDIELSGMWKFSLGDRSNWKGLEYDDEHWHNVLVPSPWEKQGFDHVDGKAWYRKEVIIKAEQTGEEWVLVLGLIDDFDKTYVNGVLVGETRDNYPFGFSSSYRTLRTYRINKNLLREGKNIIAIQVTDIGNVGGIYEGPVGMTPAKDFNASDWVRKNIRH